VLYGLSACLSAAGQWDVSTRWGGRTYVSLSGNHWHVRLGQSSACAMTRSYRYGEFFFLYEGQPVPCLHRSTRTRFCIPGYMFSTRRVLADDVYGPR
jgi:hypothetical protein